MSLKSFKIGIGVAGAIVVAFAVAIAAVAWRGEDTRNIVEKVDSSCARAHDLSLPRQARDQATTECARNVCFALRDVLTKEAFEQVTRCPGKGVVIQSSPTASQPSGPGDSGSTVSDPPSSEPSSPAPETPKSPTPEPTEPPTPEPPTPEPPTRPLIDLRPVVEPVCQTVRPIAGIC